MFLTRCGICKEMQQTGENHPGIPKGNSCRLAAQMYQLRPSESEFMDALAQARLTTMAYAMQQMVAARAQKHGRGVAWNGNSLG